ncbi:hypothetical protein AAKU55_005969, partial [Oxalobacteraceae bacterium GrIS 1.11]
PIPGERDRFRASSGISGHDTGITGHDAGMALYSRRMVLRILQPNGYAASFFDWK